MRKIILTLCAFISIIACKNDKKESITNTNSTIEESLIKELIVKIHYETNKSDEFTLMLNNIKKDEFQRKNIRIIEKVEPTTTLETISAAFGENNMSSAFTILLGSKEVKWVKIKSMNLSYGYNNLALEASQINEYFKTNDFVTIDSLTGKIQTKKINNKHNPAIFLKGKAIEILIKKN